MAAALWALAATGARGESARAAPSSSAFALGVGTEFAGLGVRWEHPLGPVALGLGAGFLMTPALPTSVGGAAGVRLGGAGGGPFLLASGAVGPAGSAGGPWVILSAKAGWRLQGERLFGELGLGVLRATRLPTMDGPAFWQWSPDATLAVGWRL